jgi:hypothetical protein
MEEPFTFLPLTAKGWLPRKGAADPAALRPGTCADLVDFCFILRQVARREHGFIRGNHDGRDRRQPLKIGQYAVLTARTGTAGPLPQLKVQ